MADRIRSGNALSRAFAVLGQAFGPLLALAVLLQLPVLAISLGSLAIGAAGGLEGPALWTWIGMAAIVALLLGSLATAVVTQAVVSVLRGQPASFTASFRAGIAVAGAAIGVAFLSTLAIAGGLLLLVVPGAIMACALFVAAPAAVVERLGPVAALERSWQLTKGHRWNIFGVTFAIGFMARVASKAAGAFFQDLQSEEPTMGVAVAGALVAWGVEVLGQLVLSVAAAVTYHDLRLTKDGWQEDEADAFD